MFICTLREREVETGVLWALSFEKFLLFAAIMTGSSRMLLTEQALPGVGSTDVIPPQSTGTLPPYDPYDFGYRFNISMAIVVVVIIAAFLFLGFILFYLRNRWSMERRIFSLQQQRQVDPSRLANRHGLDRGMVENFPLMRCGSAKAANAGRGSMDCSVCLTEFEDDEKLRILPNCGHGFHPDCIDMWLLSHSTCPLCRISLVPSTCDHIAIATPTLQTFDATLPEAQAAAAAAGGNDLQNLSETREDSSLVDRLAVRALSRNSESFRKAAQDAELLCADEGDGTNSSRRWKIMRARFTEPQQQICNCTTEENRDANLQKSRNMETESAFDDQSESYHVQALDTYTRDGSRSMATDQEQFSVAKSNSLLGNEEGHQTRRNEETGWVSINLDAAAECPLPLHTSHHFQIQSENH